MRNARKPDQAQYAVSRVTATRSARGRKRTIPVVAVPTTIQTEPRNHRPRARWDAPPFLVTNWTSPSTSASVPKRTCMISGTVRQETRSYADSDVLISNGPCAGETRPAEYGNVNRHVDACHLRHPHRARAAQRPNGTPGDRLRCCRQAPSATAGRPKTTSIDCARPARRAVATPVLSSADSPAAAPAGSGARRRTSSTTPCVPSNRPTGKPASSECGARRQPQPSSSKRGSNTRTPCASSSLHCTTPTSPAPPESTRSTDGQ